MNINHLCMKSGKKLGLSCFHINIFTENCLVCQPLGKTQHCVHLWLRRRWQMGRSHFLHHKSTIQIKLFAAFTPMFFFFLKRKAVHWRPPFLWNELISNEHIIMNHPSELFSCSSLKVTETNLQTHAVHFYAACGQAQHQSTAQQFLGYTN